MQARKDLTERSNSNVHFFGNKLFRGVQNLNLFIEELYQGESYSAIQKAKIMFYSLCAFIMTLLGALVIDLQDGKGSIAEAVFFNTAVLPIILIGILAILKGKAQRAAPWIVTITTLIFILTSTMIGVSEEPAAFYLSTAQFYGLPILFSALLTNRKTVISTILMILLWLPAYWFLFCAGTAWDLMAYSEIALSCLSILTYGLMLHFEMSFQRTESQLHENQKLNAELEKRVQIRTQELENARNEALAATRAKSDFLANMSHEIRTPLSGIIGMTQLLAKKPMDEEDRENIQVIIDSGSHLLSVIQEILDYSKIEAGRMEMDIQPFALEPLLEMVRNVIATKAYEKKLTLQFTIDPSLPPWIVGDEVRIRQVLLNLLGNAVKFTEQGFVRLTVQRVSGQGNEVSLLFQVTDSGIGMEPVTISRIFERYVQADASTNRRFGGTGLGLSISRSLLKMMGSELRVSSQPEMGSTFEFSIEASIFDVPNHQVARPVIHEKFGNGRPVLVVEDNDLNAKLITRVLENSGFQATWAENGKKALTQLLETPFAIVFMDCQMPIQDGLQTTQIMRGWANSENPLASRAATIPVIGLTADALQGSREVCLRAGMNDYLSKPFQIDTIEKVLKRWLP